MLFETISGSTVRYSDTPTGLDPMTVILRQTDRQRIKSYPLTEYACNIPGLKILVGGSEIPVEELSANESIGN